jgi:hypothetical protein
MDQQFVASLEQTLVQATLPDSQAIKDATARLAAEFYTNSQSLPALLFILQSNQNEQIRLLAAVESRKLVMKHWTSIDAATKQRIKESILQYAFTESSKRIRHQTASVITAIAQSEFEDGSWDSLVQLLAHAATDDSSMQNKETAAFILWTLLEGGIPELGQSIGSFLELFSKTVQDQSSREVRVYSVLSLTAAAGIAESYINTQPELAVAFKNVIPSMVQVLKDVMTANDEDSAKQVFNAFNDMLLFEAKMIGDNLISLVQIMIEIASNTQVEAEIRGYALQFLSSAVTFRKGKIASKKLGRDITLAALKISSEPIDVEAELEDEDDDNENEESDPPSLALRLIAISSIELPPSQIVTTIFEQLPHMLSSANQFERRAGLLAIGVAVAGAPDFYTTQMEKIIGALIAGLKDSEVVVRVAALRSLSTLISDMKDLMSEHYESLLPLIIEIIDSATNVTVYKYACTSLDALIEFMSIEGITKYLEPLMNKLFQMLQSTDSSKLRAIIVSAIGSTAYAAGIAFIPYFTKSVETLEPFIQDAGNVEGMSEDDIELRALTFENISTMARAVKSESFSQVAKPLIDSAYIAIQSESSRLREAGYAFISNMAKVYGKEFAAFLPNIMPEIYKTLEQEEFNLNFNPDNDDELQGDEEDLGEKFQVHTGITIEKEIAAIALSELAIGTKELFAPYIEQSVHVLAEQAQESYGMRETALSSLWNVVEAMTSTVVEKKTYPKGVPTGSYVNEHILSLIKHARELSITLLNEEYESVMVSSVLDSLSSLLSKYGPIIIMDHGDSSSLEALCGELMTLLKGEHMCQTLDDDEIPEDEEVDGSEMEALLTESALEVLVALSEALGPDFGQIFASFKNTIVSDVTSKDKNKRVYSVGALADIASNLKESNQYSDELLQLLMDRLEHDKSVEVRGNSAYGVGLLVYHGSNNYSSIYSNIFNSLSKLLNKVQKQQSNAAADDEETRDVVHRAYANACGCVSRLALKQQDATPLSVVLPILFEHLPLELAYEEYAPIYELLIKLYQTGNEDIVSYTPKVIEIFAHIFSKEESTDKLERESTLGREENIDLFRQFKSAESKQQVVELLKFLESKFAGSVSQNAVLSKYL